MAQRVCNDARVLHSRMVHQSRQRHVGARVSYSQLGQDTHNLRISRKVKGRGNCLCEGGDGVVTA